MELQKGRPANCAGRLEREIAVYDLLDSLHIGYERTDHAAADTMEDCYEIDRVLDTVICKNLFLCNRQRTQYYLLMMPGTKPFHTKDLSHQIGSARLSFASPEHMERLLDITPGSVSILGLMNDRENRVRLLIDLDLLRDEFLCCHPCINSSTLKLRMADVLDKLIPTFGNALTYVDLPRYEQNEPLKTS